VSRPLPPAISTNPQPIDVPPAPNLPSNPSNPSSSNPQPIRRQQGKTLVIIDPGHGGKDPGAIGLQGLREKDVILPISQEVASILERQGIQVIMTRKSDYFVSLEGRTVMANQAGADLFVSIHANSMGKGRPDVSGFEIYYYGNRGLSDAIHRSVTRSVNVRDRGVRSARFYVLRNSRMPSTLVEVGFVTGYEDSVKLSNPSFRSQMAQAIARGILEYLQRNR
jgi:N-acetylmuramoyl-L-alanine amidase